jgi:diacylglycerol diphosphate phosphatase / phosphatidate phosphatase
MILAFVAAVAVTTSAASPSPSLGDEVMHHLAWYGPEYAAVATIGVLAGLDVSSQIPIGPALLGPRFDPERPNLAALMDPRLDRVVGAPYVQEKIPTRAVLLGDIGALLITTAIDAAVAHDGHRTHNLVLGGLESVAATFAITEALKLSVGRLRPDYRDRYVRAACGGVVDAPAGLDCSAVVADGFVVSADDLRDGRVSFVSGHTSSSFAMASYLFWHLGSSYVWNDQAPPWAPAVAALGAGALLGTAGIVGATRLADGRHHPEDVVAGAALGTTIGTAMWFVHFGLDGHARRRSWSNEDASHEVTVAPMVTMLNGNSTVGAMLAGRF